MPVAVAADAIVPVIPGDEIVMSAASLAADGQLPFTPIVLVAAVAMFLGDQVMFALGRRWGRRARRAGDAGNGADTPAGGRRAATHARVRRILLNRGIVPLVAARFLPGGRTAVSVLAGRLDYPVGLFRLATAIGAPVQICYAVLLGTVGQRVVPDAPLIGAGLAMVVGLVASLMVSAVLGVVRRGRRESPNTSEPIQRLEAAASAPDAVNG